MKKIIDYFMITVALIVTVVFYFRFDLEGILWNSYEREEITAAQTKEDRVTDYTGQKAGDGIVSLTTGAEWDAVINQIDYVTVIPESIVKTDVYSLAKWADYYTKRSNGTSGRRRPEVKQSSFDLSANYCPYYIIELKDGTRILTQMNRGLAAKIEKGESVELPLGRKLGFLQTAKNMLSPICKSLNVSTDYVLYTIDDNWQSKNADNIIFIKLVLSVILFFVLAVVLQLLADRLFFKGNKQS